MGLTTYAKPLPQFEIAGADKRFYPATAFIRNGTVLLSVRWLQPGCCSLCI